MTYAVQMVSNCRAVLRMNHMQFYGRRMPNEIIFQWLHHQLRETGSFHVSRHDAGRRRAVCDLMANIILFSGTRVTRTAAVCYDHHSLPYIFEVNLHWERE
ncbi:hypothetical protein TNCV_1343221 [Trichonephila clavipes]|nr:hypothetical protein TNCV_1343221 [Trichonephila clavipes]